MTENSKPTNKGSRNSPNTAEANKRSSKLETDWGYDFQLSPQTYEDALFTDDEALEQALEEAAKKRNPVKETQPPVLDTLASQTPSQEVTPLAVKIDLNDFLAQPPKVEHSPVSNDGSSESSTSLAVVNEGLNSSLITPLLNQQEYIELSTPPEQSKTENTADISHRPFSNTLKAYSLEVKAQLHEYFGLSLPERKFQLNFQFKATKPKSSFDFIASSPSIRKLFSYKGASPVSIIKQADTELENIVKCKLSNHYQLNVLDTYAPLLAGMIRSFIASIEKKTSAPGNAKRLELAIHAQSSLKHLISGYKQVYFSMYMLPNYLYGPKRKKINACAFRLIDLLYLEQRLSTALQRVLPVGSAKTFNALYHALFLYEPLLLKKNNASLALNCETTIEKLFLQYQVMQCVDMMSLSVRQHKVVYHYIQYHLGLLTLVSTDSLAKIVEPLLEVVYDSGDTPQWFHSVPNKHTVSPLIRIVPLFNLIKKDYKECLSLLGKTAVKHSSRALALFPIYEVTFVLSVLNRCFYQVENNTKQADYLSYKPQEQLVAYSGFSTCLDYLNYQYEMSLVDPLEKSASKTTAIIKPKAGKNKWLCAMEDKDSLYLQTSELISDLTLDVGEVVVFVKKSDDTPQLQLAIIKKMERVQHDKLNIVVNILASKAINITIVDKDQQIPAIIFLYDAKRYLITTHNQCFWSGKKINIKLPDKSEQSVFIDVLKLISHKFQILKLI